MTLEEFLKELRTNANITTIEFNFFEAKDTKLLMLDLNVCIGNRKREEDHKWLEFDLGSKPLEFQKKLPKNFTSILKQIKKEIRKKETK